MEWSKTENIEIECEQCVSWRGSRDRGNFENNLVAIGLISNMFQGYDIVSVISNRMLNILFYWQNEQKKNFVVDGVQLNKCQEDALEKSADYIGEIRRKAKREIGRGERLEVKQREIEGGGGKKKSK